MGEFLSRNVTACEMSHRSDSASAKASHMIDKLEIVVAVVHLTHFHWTERILYLYDKVGQFCQPIKSANLAYHVTISVSKFCQS